MVAGHLREQNGYFQMILSWKGKDGKRKSKSISTGLQVKGNKKRAEALLLKTRKEFNPDNLLENSDMLFTEFLSKWLKDNAAAMTPNYFATVSYDTMATIIPYFENILFACLNSLQKKLKTSIAMSARTMKPIHKICSSITMQSSQPWGMRLKSVG